MLISKASVVYGNLVVMVAGNYVSTSHSGMVVFAIVLVCIVIVLVQQVVIGSICNYSRSSSEALIIEFLSVHCARGCFGA